MADAKERMEKTISTILLVIIILVLIYKCYQMEIDMEDIKIKHNELARIVGNNANVLNVVVSETDKIMEDFYNEKGDMIDEE